MQKPSKNWDELWDVLTPKEQRLVHKHATDVSRELWLPLAGPQDTAFSSQADIIGYGGAAGGGKTDLMCGKSLLSHKKTMILRREGTQLVGILDRLEEIIGDKDGFNGKDKIWRLDKGRQIEFGSVPHAGDETKYQGRPHDLLAFDETANFLEAQVRFLLGWNRTTDPRQKCQTLMAFNPPTSAEGRWIVSFFAPWIDPKYEGEPALPGELRWMAQLPTKTGEYEDIEVPSSTPFVLGPDNKPIFEFDPEDYQPTEIITPRSRTFIPSKIGDNPYLLGTGYMSQLQALPEPLRSQMLNGDFNAGVTDDPWQVIPTAWVDAAQARWEEKHAKPEMDSLGIDVARGGKDRTIIAKRYGVWYDHLLVYPGTETPDGPIVAGLVVSAARDGAPQHIDVIGVGSSPYDFLLQARQNVIGINASEKSDEHDQSGRLGFLNVRSAMWWKMREDLDPANGRGICLPPDKALAKELCAPKWKLRGTVIQVQSREEIIEKTGISPDRATAVCQARMDTPKLKKMRYPGSVSSHESDIQQVHDHDNLGHNPYENL